MSLALPFQLFQMQDPVGTAAQKGLIMGNEDHRQITVSDEFLKPDQGL